MYKKETLSRAETTYSDSFFVLRPQLCDSWCLLPAGTKLMHQLHCFLWKTLFCTPQFCFVCSMATCLSAGQGLSASRLLRTSESLRWFCAIRKRSASLLSSDGSVAILQSTSVWQPLHFMHLHRVPCQKLRMDFALNRCHVPANGMQQWAIFNCLLFCLHVCLHCFLQICRLIWLFLTLVHVGVWQQACTQHLPEGK